MLEMNVVSPGAKVLVVEDEEPLALLLRYNLEAEGYTVDVVHRGDEAEVAIAESSPDLIVLDWMLPGLSGLELCRRLRTGKRSEEHTSELQSQFHLVCRLLLEKKKKTLEIKLLHVNTHN